MPLRSVLQHKYFPVVWMCIGWIGLFYSRSLLSIFYGGLGALACIQIFNADYRLRLRHHFPSLCFIGIWLVYLLSGLWSDNSSAWWQRININMPYLAILPGIMVFKWTQDQLRRVIWTFIGVASISVLITLILYGLNIEYYHRLYKVGQVMPTPVLHVRYAYFLACPLVPLWCLSMRDQLLSDRFSRKLVYIYSVLIIVFIHLLAVRTGIAVLYGSIVCYAVYISWYYKKIGYLFMAGIGMISIASFSYYFFPTVQQKINYVKWDLQQLRETGGQAQYSDNLRVSSIKNGWTLAMRQPLLGSGIGDLEDDMNALYRERQPGFPDDANYPPVNQLIHWFASFGFLGGLLVIVLFLRPLFYSSRYKVALVFLFLATTFSFLGEATIELQLGKCFFLMWVGLLTLHPVNE